MKGKKGDGRKGIFRKEERFLCEKKKGGGKGKVTEELCWNSN